LTAVVGNCWLRWAVLACFCSTICSTLHAQTFRCPLHSVNGLILLDATVNGA